MHISYYLSTGSMCSKFTFGGGLPNCDGFSFPLAMSNALTLEAASAALVKQSCLFIGAWLFKSVPPLKETQNITILN